MQKSIFSKLYLNFLFLVQKWTVQQKTLVSQQINPKNVLKRWSAPGCARRTAATAAWCARGARSCLRRAGARCTGGCRCTWCAPCPTRPSSWPPTSCSSCCSPTTRDVTVLGGNCSQYLHSIFFVVLSVWLAIKFYLLVDLFCWKTV